MGLIFDLRGISNETMKKHGIIYNQKTFQSLINQENTKKYFGDKYRHKSYEDRDIIIPIFKQRRHSRKTPAKKLIQKRR